MWRITLRFVGSRPRSGKHHLGHIPLAKAQSRGCTLLQRRLGNVVCAQEESGGGGGGGGGDRVSEHNTVSAPNETSNRVFRCTYVVIKCLKARE